MIKKISSGKIFGSMLAVAVLTSACNSVENNKEAQPEDVVVEDVFVEEDIIIVEDVWIIDEHQINDIPVTTKSTTIETPTESTPKAASTEGDGEEVENVDYQIHSPETVDQSLVAADYEPQVIGVTEVIVPLDETQTVIAYNKKGKEVGEMQVISSGDGSEIDQIIFTDKKHKDVYDVQAGMTTKEVKKLRKEMKHMQKKGQVFLYDDQSNVMYLLDVEYDDGTEILEGDIENSEVQAIIWKDKKHHNK